MPRDLTAWQLANSDSATAKPICLMQLNHSGAVEYISATGAVTYDGQLYTAGGFNISSIIDSRSATFTLIATPARVAEVTRSAYRRGLCMIYYIPGEAGDTPTYTADKAVLLLDGRIDTSSVSDGLVTVVAMNKYLTGRMGPGYTFNQFCTHMPAPGSSIVWEGETAPFEAVEETPAPPRNPFYLW